MKRKQSYYLIPEDGRFTKNVKEKEFLNKGMIESPCYMFIDQATKTGISIFDSKKRLITTVYLEKQNEENVEFRNKLKKELSSLIDDFGINKVFYEKVYGGQNFETVQVLIAIQETVVDISHEKEIKHYGLENKKWKSRLSYPIAWKTTKDEKAEIRRYVEEYYPLIKNKQDVIDSLGMAIAVLFKGDKGTRPLEMRLDKKLPMFLEVLIISDINEIYDKIHGLKSFKKSMDKEIKTFDYDTKSDINTNFRYILSNYDCIAISEIPHHKSMGQIMLIHNIKPSDIPENGFLLGVARRKK